MQQSSGATTANATGNVTPFMSMEDSPMFRNTVRASPMNQSLQHEIRRHANQLC